MFKRPPNTKTSAPVRSSDLRRLRLDLPRTASGSSSSSSVDPALLLPDGTLAAKATTHLGEPCTLYLAPRSLDPRAFRLPRRTDLPQLVPTCYALDLAPTLLPVLETAPQVVPHLVTGSALFAAGVSPRSIAHLPADLPVGSLVAVVVLADPPSRRVVAVGQLAATPTELVRMQQASGDTKGTAVLTLHARGDHLWAAGSGVDAPLPPDPTTTSPSSSSSTNPRTSAPADVSSGDSTPAPAPALRPASPDCSPAPAAADAPERELTPTETDAVLLDALLLSLSTTLSTAPLPLPASLLYSAHLLPHRPASGPGATAEIKRSSFKKLDRLVKAAAKKGWITTKDVKGEVVVVAVNPTHPDVEALRPYKTLAAAAQAAQRAETTTQATAGTDSADRPSRDSGGAGGRERKRSGLEVQELWKPSSDRLQELLRQVEHERPPQDLYTSAQLSTVLRRFADQHALAHPSHRALLVLSPSALPPTPAPSDPQRDAMELLARVVLNKTETAETVGAERGHVGCMGREEALQRVVRHPGGPCTPYWAYLNQNGERVVKKGSPPRIRVQIKNVGKRQVTLVSGYEAWELFTSEELAEELKHRSASSTSIQPLAGSAKKGGTPKVEIMCQGTHDALVVGLLTARGIPRSLIDVDLSKSKK